MLNRGMLAFSSATGVDDPAYEKVAITSTGTLHIKTATNPYCSVNDNRLQAAGTIQRTTVESANQAPLTSITVKMV
jgi:hypothetical protein